jgi:hypothetical protein
MTRFALLAVGFLALTVSARGADEAKGAKAAHTVYDAYFEKNNSGLKGATTYLALTTKEGFEKVFAARPPLMGGKKPVLLAADAFDMQFVVVVVTRGPAITTYTVEAVTLDKDGTVYVQYKTTTGPAGTATFASPLIVSVAKENAKKVVFIENGKTVGTSDVK